MENLIITPKTKISELLDAYPDLEDLLIQLAPAFKKLKNPVLRKTVAKITSIGQAAIIGKLNVEELVNQLRHAAGQDHLDATEDGEITFVTEKPDWFTYTSIVDIIDTRDMLNAGEHPVHVVLSGVKQLKEGEILKIITPFLPVPLIEKAASLGAQHWVDQQHEELYSIYFFVK
ncbi:DUF1858 domain-containing protein [Roseimarinus sediminis]|jgi:uncharacterized protein (DUF2249 family)|uniref:DUF1858 domain-containing protein n=1 Tax=Roseimarinus sediminis TaxID=1610899 RepID=UPI003D22F000